MCIFERKKKHELGNKVSKFYVTGKYELKLFTIHRIQKQEFTKLIREVIVMNLALSWNK